MSQESSADTVLAWLWELSDGTRAAVVEHTSAPQWELRVTKNGDDEVMKAEVRPLSGPGRIEELARMLAGSAITAKTRAHAKELYERHRRGGPA